MAPLASAPVALCLFAKPPRPGRSKTRLAAALGETGAARLADAFVRDAWVKIAAIAWARPVLATTDARDPVWRALGCTDVWPQGAGDLGRRMERVLRRALESHPSAIAVGTDVPALPRSRFDCARDALASHDAVLGPSEDGGFYLIGLRRCPSGLLSGIAWSTGEARAQTIDRLHSAGLTVALLSCGFDVDRPADVDRLRAMGDDLSETAPETVRALRDLDGRGQDL
jgi:hypothetical protein